MTDDYFLYESDEFPSSWQQEPVIKLLSKRQVDPKESKDVKKPVAMKPQPNSNPENSSNQKLNSQFPVSELPQGNSKFVLINMPINKNYLEFSISFRHSEQ